MPLVRKMSPDLWEVRINLSDKIARVLFTIKNQKMILLHGFIKKSQKTPNKELEIAEIRLKNLQIQIKLVIILNMKKKIYKKYHFIKF
jgi:phage-related protein